MPFSGNRPNGLVPLKLNKKTVDYKKLYKENHKLFCQRFIDTVLSYYMDYIMEQMVKYQIDIKLFEWGVWDTDMFLWKIRDTLDSFMESEYVMNTIRNEFITNAIDDLFSELEDENNNLKISVKELEYLNCKYGI